MLDRRSSHYRFKPGDAVFASIFGLRTEALARRFTDHGHDAHRHSGSARREGRGLDGKGQRRTVSATLMVESWDSEKI
jgi:hypothetical protein